MDANSGKVMKEQVRNNILEEINDFNYTEKVNRLKELFVCRPDPKRPPDKYDLIMIKRGIMGNRTPEIINKCRFFRNLEVDYDHILDFCCNNFENCPHYIKFRRSQEELDRIQRPFYQ